MVHTCERGSVPLREQEEAVCRHLLQVENKVEKVFIGIPEGWNWSRWECADLQVGSTFPVDGTGVAFSWNEESASVEGEEAVQG